MLSTDSPLNRLPSNLHPNQVLLLDGVRTCALIAKDKTLELHRQLHSVSFTEKPPASHLIFDCAWSIIDNAYRFQKIARIFGSETGCSIDSAALASIDQVRALRNTIQHLDERIAQNAMMEEQAVPFGQIGWIARKGTSDDNGQIFSMTCGYYPFSEQKFNVLNPCGRVLLNTIDRVTLTALGRDSAGSYNLVSLSIEEVLTSIKLCMLKFEAFADEKMRAMPPAPKLYLDNLMHVSFHSLTGMNCVMMDDSQVKVRSFPSAKG
jgi:hypothetical protein